MRMFTSCRFFIVNRCRSVQNWCLITIVCVSELPPVTHCCNEPSGTNCSSEPCQEKLFQRAFSGQTVPTKLLGQIVPTSLLGTNRSNKPAWDKLFQQACLGQIVPTSLPGTNCSNAQRISGTAQSIRVALRARPATAQHGPARWRVRSCAARWIILRSGELFIK
jgi:hypothetical protein